MAYRLLCCMLCSVDGQARHAHASADMGPRMRDLLGGISEPAEHAAETRADNAGCRVLAAAMHCSPPHWDTAAARSSSAWLQLAQLVAQNGSTLRAADCCVGCYCLTFQQRSSQMYDGQSCRAPSGALGPQSWCSPPAAPAMAEGAWGFVRNGISRWSFDVGPELQGISMSQIQYLGGVCAAAVSEHSRVLHHCDCTIFQPVRHGLCLASR